ncbi:MAG: alpha/beta hydrolase [Leptospiraceae bacterium]|nr:alpha/beta hydrolase [Leptospiraceae bacterium]
MTEPTDYAIADDGVKLPWYRKGKGDDVFIFNGFACVQDNLKPAIEHLSRHFRVTSWDYRGHGKADKNSGTSPDKANLDQFMRDALSVMNSARIKKTHLLGYSMGAQFGMEFAYRNNSSIKRIIGLNGIYGNAFDDVMGTDFVAKLLPQLKFEIPLLNEAYAKIWKAALGVPFELKYNIAAIAMVDRGLVKPDDFKPYLDQLENLEGPFMLALMQEIHSHQTYSFLPKIENQALIIMGEKDPLATPAMGKKVVELLPNAELLIIEKGTHNSNLERPQEIFPRIEQFLKSGGWTGRLKNIFSK